MSSPMQTQSYAVSSNPSSASKNRTYRFLESIAQNSSSKENSVYMKILSLRTEKQKLRERRKKLKAAIKDKYMNLQSIEQQIDIIGIEISRLESIKEKDSDSDSQMSMR
jgi:predicted  nucleic acid-binding Zn-ribbon protein